MGSFLFFLIVFGVIAAVAYGLITKKKSTTDVTPVSPVVPVSPPNKGDGGSGGGVQK